MNVPRYETIELLRSGRDLEVYDVWSEERACRCVMKTVRPDRLHRDGPARRVLAEGRLLCRLTHPHIVRAYEVIEEPVPMVVMETLAGETLSHMVAVRDVRLSAAEVTHLGLHLASAVRYLHGHGWLHLDLKPSNVIAECGRAKLIDLSVARPPGPAHRGVGTFFYMAPEQARGGDLGAPADVWGLGAVLFEAATGEPAFDDPDADEVDGDVPYADSDEPDANSDDGPTDESEYPQLQGRARRADELRPMPAELADLIAACLEPEPGRRPGVTEVLRVLESIAELPAAERRF